MRKSWWLINLLLLVGASGLVWKLHADWRQDRAQNGPQSVQPSRLPTLRAPAAPVPRDYGRIAQQNPFSADRNDTVVSPQQAAAAAAAGPPPLYYGSVIFGNQRFVLLGLETDSKVQRVSEGQTFDGYKVASVRPESVVFESAAGTSEVMLYNAIARLHRSFAKTQPAAATAAPRTSSTGPSSSAAGNVVSTGSASPSPAVAQSATSPPPGSEHQGKHLIQTPFGPIWVRN